LPQISTCSKGISHPKRAKSLSQVSGILDFDKTSSKREWTSNETDFRFAFVSESEAMCLWARHETRCPVIIDWRRHALTRDMT
jgi:hypothetical protein